MARRRLRATSKKAAKLLNRSVRSAARAARSGVTNSLRSALGAQEVRRASTDAGQAVPSFRKQPLAMSRYLTEDKESYVALVGQTRVTFSRWPDDRSDLHVLALRAAVERFGVYAESWSVTGVWATNAAADKALPEWMRR
jgi:hypothetical protein